MCQNKKKKDFAPPLLLHIIRKTISEHT